MLGRPTPIFFTAANITAVPEGPGVYFLYRRGRLIHIGLATQNRTLRSELERHHRGEYGACTQAATAFDYELDAHPAALYRAYCAIHARLGSGSRFA
jgi:hypothetical protein